MSVFKMCLWQEFWARPIRQTRFEITIVPRELCGISPAAGPGTPGMVGKGIVIQFSDAVISYQLAG